jgi:type II secretory pathway pseudopilin PulG
MKKPGTCKAAGFALVELILVLLVLSVLAAMHLPFYSRLRERTYVTIDQNNIRQILRGSALYSAENNDYLPHPTWGTGLTGPDGWAYATENRGRIPDVPAFAPSCFRSDVNSAQFTNQAKFFKLGQATQYLPNVRTAWCPKDVGTRGSGLLRQLWLERAVKVTSYSWNGTVGGFPGGRLPVGGTYKGSQFLPSDWQMWEENEADPFSFNDAGSNPEAVLELLSYRHSGLKQWWTVRSSQQLRNLPGVGMIGTFDGAAKFVNLARVYHLAMRRVPVPNELLNGPPYRQ